MGIEPPMMLLIFIGASRSVCCHVAMLIIAIGIGIRWDVGGRWLMIMRSMVVIPPCITTSIRMVGGVMIMRRIVGMRVVRGIGIMISVMWLMMMMTLVVLESMFIHVCSLVEQGLVHAATILCIVYVLVFTPFLYGTTTSSIFMQGQVFVRKCRSANISSYRLSFVHLGLIRIHIKHCPVCIVISCVLLIRWWDRFENHIDDNVGPLPNFEWVWVCEKK